MRDLRRISRDRGIGNGSARGINCSERIASNLRGISKNSRIVCKRTARAFHEKLDCRVPQFIIRIVEIAHNTHHARDRKRCNEQYAGGNNRRALRHGPAYNYTAAQPKNPPADINEQRLAQPDRKERLPHACPEHFAAYKANRQEHHGRTRQNATLVPGGNLPQIHEQEEHSENKDENENH